MSPLDRLWATWRSGYVEAITDRPRPDCVFCAILTSGEPDTETHVVWRHPAGRVVALLNAYPYGSGHVLILPVRHVGELEDLDVEIRPARTEQIALRLYEDDLKTLKKLAKRRGVGHTTLARSIVERWLATLQR